MEERKKPPAAEQVERYRQEMLDMYRQKQPAAPPQPESQQGTWLDERYPLPDPVADRVQEEAETPAPSEAPPLNESPFVGYLRIFVFTANGAEPLAGARVTVTRPGEGGQVLYANAVTDIDGFTPVIPLPTVDPAFSLQPDGPQPFVAYDIRIAADGFRPAVHENVPIYGNNYVTQPVSLVPLLPGEPEEDASLFQSGGPANL